MSMTHTGPVARYGYDADAIARHHGVMDQAGRAEGLRQALAAAEALKAKLDGLTYYEGDAVSSVAEDVDRLIVNEIRPLAEAAAEAVGLLVIRGTG